MRWNKLTSAFLCLFLCYLNFLCLCLFIYHKCEPGLFHLIAHLVILCLFLCYLNFLCLCYSYFTSVNQAFSSKDAYVNENDMWNNLLEKRAKVFFQRTWINFCAASKLMLLIFPIHTPSCKTKLKRISYTNQKNENGKLNICWRLS